MKSLSKSRYISGLQCPKRLWLEAWRSELAPEFDDATLFLFEQGHKVGELARRRHPGGLLIGARYNERLKAQQDTKAAMAAGHPAIFEAAVECGGVAVRSDILERVPGRKDLWDLHEVKSTVTVKEEHIHDLAVQSLAWQDAGIRIRRRSLVHLNRDYARRGDIDPNALFIAEDVTETVERILPEVRDNAEEFLRILQNPDMPRAEIGKRCNAPYECPFKGICWKDVPDYPVFKLANISKDKLRMLLDGGILRLKDIPPDFPLTANQRMQVQVERDGSPIVLPAAIAKLMEELFPPFYFLDFETVAFAIPPYDGLRPYQAIPFLASVHLQKMPGAKPEHLSFIGDGETDPRENMAEFLCQEIGPEGSIIAYNASFEKRVLRELCGAFPERESRLNQLVGRVWDLMTPFSRRLLVEPGFKGSYSQKAVLPTLVPGMSYAGLAIQDGIHAQLAYAQLMENGAAPEIRRKVLKDLEEYCAVDSLGMVKILERLREIMVCGR